MCYKIMLMDKNWFVNKIVKVFRTVLSEKLRINSTTVNVNKLIELFYLSLIW